jgi:phosphonate metabolism protein PhnN/1,5-bisphosphokinase (PRPP-forming)
MFILVVGPSGAGKDAVLLGARRVLAADGRFRFVRRVITRPADPRGENHEPISAAEFARRKFALWWEAHGLRYGIPLDVTADLSRGVAVVANVSRAVIAEAAERFPVRVIEITAPAEIRARRLAARGRESADDVANRLARSIPVPDHVRVDTIQNDATLDAAVQAFVSILERIVGLSDT